MIVTRYMEFETLSGEVRNLTDEVQEALERVPLKTGVVTVFVPGATGAVTTIEYEDGLVADLADALQRIAPEEIEYATQQDDFVMEVMLEAASYYLRKDQKRMIILDGRPFVYAYQVQEVLDYAKRVGQPVKIVHCECSDETARMRLADPHLAANRNYELYLKLKAIQEPLPGDRIEIDTDKPLEESVRMALEAFQA